MSSAGAAAGRGGVVPPSVGDEPTATRDTAVEEDAPVAPIPPLAAVCHRHPPWRQEPYDLLKLIEEDVWLAERTFEGYGTDFGARCTVIRLPDGGLFVHSPVLLTVALRAALAALGPVRFLAVPTGHHVAFAEQWRAVFPAATCVAFPGARERLACLSDATELGGSAVNAAAVPGERDSTASVDTRADAGAAVPTGMLVPGVLSWVFLGAERGFQEVAFFHHPSATLVISDAFFRIPPPPPGGFPLGARLFFWYLRTVAIPLHSALAWGAKATWRAEAAALVHWAPRRVIPCHGELVLEEGAVDVLRDFFRHRRGAF